MDARIQPQSSICSDSNGEENGGNEVAEVLNNRRICLVGALGNDAVLRSVADSFSVPVICSADGRDSEGEEGFSTVYVLESFEGNVYSYMCQRKHCLLGPVALRQLAAKNEALPDNTRPLFNLSMSGVVVCFTGFRDKNDLASLVPLIHHMGGSIRKNVTHKVTHLISNVCSGEKYRYAALFRVPVMNPQWVYASWGRKDDVNFSATTDVFVAEYKLKPFHGAKVAFVGFADDEKKHMIDILLSNGGTVAALDDPQCTHVVLERSEVYTLEATSAELSSPPPPLSILPDPVDDNLNYNGFLETLHEKSRENTTANESLSSGRKRKNSSCDQSSHQSKRRKEKCASEKKRKVSGIFKTPLNYFSNRRRTIDAASFNESLNQSVVSSSGLFHVENLSVLNDSQCTPKTKKKSLFSRTFSSSKFTRNKLKRNYLNATRLSFGGEGSDNEAHEPLNASCFPNISLNPFPNELRSDCTKDVRGPSVSTLLVVDESSLAERPETISTKIFVVKAEWFWTSVQKEICLEEKDYLYDDYVQQNFSPSARRDSHSATPSSASRRKRKRLHEAVLSLAHQQSPGLHKRRSSVSDAGLLSMSGSFLDCTSSPGDKALVDGAEPAIEAPRKGMTPRQQVFLELLQTECNYIDILHTIISTKKQLEDMPEEEALLNNTEINLIFGKLPPIYETHTRMRDELRSFATTWSEEHTIGSVVQKYSKDLLKVYPPYMNYYESMKEVLTKCDQNKPRFHAFLKACQTKPEFGRESLQDLMCRPVQRMMSFNLLLATLIKRTQKANPDHAELTRALDILKEGMAVINEDKGRAEAQVALFNMFNEIDNCPPDIVCSHRKFIAKAEVIQLSSTEGLLSKGHSLVLFLFSDLVEVCKKKSKAFSNPKSPSGLNSLQRPKMYKHVKLLPLNTIKKVIDIKETEQCQKAFCFVCRNNDELKETVYSFAMPDEDADKAGFLKTLTKQMANNACTPDADKFLAYLESHQLDIDMSDMSKGTLNKAFKFATRTKLKVGRAFSFNKTPSKLKRAVSSMMSPFGSSNNITPSSELAQMRLASYSNINELGSTENASESPLSAPLSVQPTRKMKASSLNVNAMKGM